MCHVNCHHSVDCIIIIIIVVVVVAVVVDEVLLPETYANSNVSKYTFDLYFVKHKSYTSCHVPTDTLLVTRESVVPWSLRRKGWDRGVKMLLFQCI